ncbi:Transmembrane protein [Entamoeba marina]
MIEVTDEPHMFKKDWNIYGFHIRASTRAIVAGCLWGISGILALITIILLYLIDDHFVGFIMYLVTFIPSLISYILANDFEIKTCCATPQVLLGIIFHCCCFVCVTFTLMLIGVIEPTIIVIVIQTAYIYTSITTLPFVKRYFDRFLSWVIN